MCATRLFRISAANIGPNRFHQNRTVSWLMSIPRSAKRSSTLRSDSGYFKHRKVGLAAGAREGGGDIGFLTVGGVDAHDQHMLGEPAFSIRWPDGKPVCPYSGVIGQATLVKGKSHRPGMYSV